MLLEHYSSTPKHLLTVWYHGLRLVDSTLNTPNGESDMSGNESMPTSRYRFYSKL